MDKFFVFAKTETTKKTSCPSNNNHWKLLIEKNKQGPTQKKPPLHYSQPRPRKKNKNFVQMTKKVTHVQHNSTFEEEN